MAMQAIIEALDAGAWLLTPNRRLARWLRAAHGRAQADAGRLAWTTPSVWSWNGWLHWLAEQCLPHEAEAPRLLTPDESRWLWEDIVSRSRAGEALLNTAATARLAYSAWCILRQWHLTLEAGRADNHDVAAFRDWQQEYESRCRQHRWLDETVLAERARDWLAHAAVQLPERVVLVGFDQLTPQQRCVLDVLAGAGCDVAQHTPVREARQVLRLPCADATAEIRAAAAWVRTLVQRGERNIAVVVPDLAGQRRAIERIFDQTLIPASLLTAGRVTARPYEITLGVALADVPVIVTALHALDLALGPMETVTLGRLIQSPFIGAAETEAAARAWLDVRLREGREPQVGLTWLERLARNEDRPHHCPALAARIAQVSALIATLPARQLPSVWAILVRRLLKCLGWPGERGLDSEEYQATVAWNDVLSRLAALDAITGVMSLSEAVQRLKQLARAAVFQPQGAEVPVQVLGLLEAGGLLFDHLWIMGWHDEAWPPSPQPNPFLPLSLQRRHGTPHASAERELEFARGLTQRLLASAGQVVVSHPCREGDRELRPSPLIAHLPDVGLAGLGVAAAPDYRGLIFASGEPENYSDWQAPPVSVPRVGGGAAVLRDQAACPFRAFARHRLGARALPVVGSGLDAAMRGTLLHRVMELVWRALGGQQRLLVLTTSERERVVATAVDEAIAATAKRYPATFTPRFTEIERERLQRLVLAWLDIETQRSPFEIVALEQQRVVDIAGLGLELKADRVDRLAEGGDLIIDYKTGKAEVHDWFGDRPDEPQLPLYCISHPGEVTGIAFARLAAAGCGLNGLARHAGVAEGIGEWSQSKYAEFKPQWPQLEQEWRTTLAALAAEFRAGRAALEPKANDTCSKCDLQPLCRINEFKAEVEEAEVEGEEGDDESDHDDRG